MHRDIELTYRTRVLRRSIPLEGIAIVAACVGVAGSFAAYYSSRVVTWAVMTDELQTTKLATSIAQSGSPVPQIHGTYYGALSQLYPLLIAPFYALFTAPAAATAAHILNPLLVASAAWPAYLLAESLTRSRVAATVAALLTAFTPWLVLTSTLLTENAAYPAFVWAVFLCQRALAEPSERRDILALAGLLLAFLARTQLLVLAIALPFALIGHELTFQRESLRRVFRQHRVLLIAYGVGALVAAALAAVGSLGAVVGNYSVPFKGDLRPAASGTRSRCTSTTSSSAERSCRSSLPCPGQSQLSSARRTEARMRTRGSCSCSFRCSPSR
jgi:hypothetical protein